MSSKTVRFMQGNEACAEGALAAGVRFFAGYPITPSTEIAEILSARLPQVGGTFIQMEDEVSSMAAVVGASLTGIKAMTATSGPGFSLMQENIGFASYAEVPCVIINVMRGGPSTGSPTSPAQGDVMQARWGTHGDHSTIVLSPSSVDEMYHLTIQAVNLSEEYRVPVILLADEVIAHMRERIGIPDPSQINLVERVRATGGDLPYQADMRTDVPPMVEFGRGYRTSVTGLVHNEAGFYTDDPAEVAALNERLGRKISKHRREIIRAERHYIEDADLAVVAYGSTARSALRAVREARAKGIRACLLRPITLWPFPHVIINELAARMRAIIVPEMNLGQVSREVERAAHGQTTVYGMPKVSWELFTPEEILEHVEEVDRWHRRYTSTYGRATSPISGVQAAGTERSSERS